MNIAIYVRVSTAEQAKEGYSIGEQTERLAKYAEAHGWHIFKIYTDPGFSGSNMERPALQEMIAAVKEKKFEKVLVYKLDRLSRSQKDTLTIIEDILIANNVDFVSMNENFDTSTPFGKAMIGILAVFAQLEREQIKERMGMGREARAKMGLYNGGNSAPYGYDYVEGKLIINDFEAMIVREIFDLSIQGKSPWTIAKILNEKGYPSRKGKWTYSTIDKIADSKFYIGYVKFVDQWFKGQHDPIISIDDYELAQNVIISRKAKFNVNKDNPGKATSYLTGLLYCARCGRKYYKKSNGTTRKGIPGRNNYYRCRGNSVDLLATADTKCTNKSYRMEDLDKEILEEVKKLAIEPGYYKSLRSSAADPEDKGAAIASEIKKIDAQISRFMDLYALGSMPVDVLDNKIKDLSMKKAALEENLQQIKADSSKLSIKETEKLINKIPDILHNGSVEEIRHLLSDLIDKIEIDGDEISIYWRF